MAQQFTITARFDANGAIRSIARTDKQLKKLKQSSDSVGKAASMIVGAFAAMRLGGGLVEATDEVQNLRNRLMALGESSVEATATLSQLRNVANETRSAFGSTANLFTRLKLSTQELGVSQNELLGFTKSLNQAVVLSGASAKESEAAIIQLSQGMASGTLRGDELRSVLEQLPKVADVIATGLGATRGELRQLGIDGKISAEAVLGAFKVAESSLDDQFSKTTATMGQSLEVLKNNMIETADVMLNQSGAMAALGKAVLWTAEQFKELVIQYKFWMSEATDEVKQIQAQERALAGLGRMLTSYKKELKKLEGFKVVTPEVTNRIAFLRGELAKLKKEASETNKAVTLDAPLTTQQSADLAKEKALFTQVYAKALSDAKGPQEKFTQQQKALNKLLGEGKITQGEYTALIERYKETIDRLERGSVGPQQRRIQALIDENNVRRESITFGKIEGEILRRKLELGDGEAAMTDAQVEALRKELTVRRDLILLEENKESDAVALAAENKEMATRAELLEKQADGWGGVTDAFAGFAEEANNVRAASAAVVDSIANNMTNAIVKFATTGKASMKEFATAMLADIARIIAQLLVVNALSSLGGGGLAGLLGVGAPAGTRASGGPVNRNKSYLVGEQGPEMFTPSDNGTVTANDKLVGASAAAAAPPQVNVSVVNVQDPAMVSDAISDGGSDDAIINVMARNPEAIRSILQG
jgi:tape measure domain-containing protein